VSNFKDTIKEGDKPIKILILSAENAKLMSLEKSTKMLVETVRFMLIYILKLVTGKPKHDGK
jgi:hypothetical protein